jgi:hypothetical protein
MVKFIEGFYISPRIGKKLEWNRELVLFVVVDRNQITIREEKKRSAGDGERGPLREGEIRIWCGDE